MIFDRGLEDEPQQEQKRRQLQGGRRLPLIIHKGPTEFLTGYGRFWVIMEARSPTGGGFWSDVRLGWPGVGGGCSPACHWSGPFSGGREGSGMRRRGHGAVTERRELSCVGGVLFHVSWLTRGWRAWVCWLLLLVEVGGSGTIVALLSFKWGPHVLHIGTHIGNQMLNNNKCSLAPFWLLIQDSKWRPLPTTSCAFLSTQRTFHPQS